MIKCLFTVYFIILIKIIKLSYNNLNYIGEENQPKKYGYKYICIPITFNNPLRACFSNKKSNPNAPDTDC